MIKPMDLREIEPLNKDAEKFKALHSHIGKYNRREEAKLKKLPRNFDFIDPTLIERVKEVNIFDDPEPYTAGFQHEFLKLSKRRKREDLLETMSPRNHSLMDTRPISSSSTETEDYLELESTSIVFEAAGVAATAATNHPNIDLLVSTQQQQQQQEDEEEEEYDYQSFKDEYYQQLEEFKNKNLTYNFTDKGEPEESPEDALRKIVEFKMPRNCTQEELTQIGAKAFECLMFDYRHASNETDVKKVLTRSWMVIRVWCFIYLCIAIPAWCQKGWCCCCFRCSFCFPLERIEYAKSYFAKNPPGILYQRGITKTGDDQYKYKPSAFELEAYDQLESAIRNL